MPQPVILIAIDTDHADEICRSAEPVARAMSARILLLHMLKGPATSPRSRLQAEPSEGPDRIAAAQERFQPRADELRDHGFEVTLLIQPGEVVPGIWACAQEQGAIMVVIGSDISASLLQSFQGSFTRAVLRDATCPVLVIPTHNPH